MSLVISSCFMGSTSDEFLTADYSDCTDFFSNEPLGHPEPISAEFLTADYADFTDSFSAAYPSHPSNPRSKLFTFYLSNARKPAYSREVKR
jgi:hypothetical protein